MERRARKPKKPSNSYYLGYVDDDETPEMIALKFEQLDKMGGEMNEKKMEDLFELTSSVMIQHDMYEEEQLYEDEEYEEQDDDDEDDETFQDELTPTYSVRRPRGAKSMQESKAIEMGNRFVIFKKKTWIDVLNVEDIKLPDDPIPPSWAKTIRPLTTFKKQANVYIRTYDLELYLECDSIPKYANWKALPVFTGVLIHETKQIDEIPLDVLLPSGYLFVWIEKENISSTMGILRGKSFEYVENMCWVKQNLNGTFKTEKGVFLSKSHLTLFIFKKNPKNMELRHQRNPDTVFDFVKPMEFVYHMIETLIPNGKFLELYGDRGKSRNGWHKIVEKNKYI